MNTQRETLLSVEEQLHDLGGWAGVCYWWAGEVYATGGRGRCMLLVGGGGVCYWWAGQVYATGGQGRCMLLVGGAGVCYWWAGEVYATGGRGRCMLLVGGAGACMLLVGGAGACMPLVGGLLWCEGWWLMLLALPPAATNSSHGVVYPLVFCVLLFFTVGVLVH